ncbi:MAG: hypothetical protein HQL97_12235, partial [Magnetococcales bacterium]|nr:hypothetical protein [Magnetococcales bacterium]
AGEPLPELSVIPQDLPTQTPVWRSAWLDWNRWINGLPRDALAGVVGGVTFLLLVVLRRRRAGDAKEAGEGSVRQERQEPVAVETPPVFEPAPLSAMAAAPFLVPEESPSEPGFAPDPMGELPATEPPLASLAETPEPRGMTVSLEKSAFPAALVASTVSETPSSPAISVAPVEKTDWASPPEPDVQPEVADSTLDALLASVPEPSVDARSAATTQGDDVGLEEVLEAALSDWSVTGETDEPSQGEAMGETGDSDLDLTELLMALESAPEKQTDEDPLSGEEEASLSLDAVGEARGAVAADAGEAEAFLGALEVTGLDLVREPAFMGEPDWGVAGDLEGFESLDVGDWVVDDGVTASEESLRIELERAARAAMAPLPDVSREGPVVETMATAPLAPVVEATGEAPRFERGSAAAEAPVVELEGSEAGVLSPESAPEAWAFDPSASVVTERSPFALGAEEIEMVPFDFETFQADPTLSKSAATVREEGGAAWEFIPFEQEEGVKRELRITR